MYIKALEQEVLRLKESFATTTRERDAVMEENRRLRELLAAHGIHYDFSASPVKFNRQNSAFGQSSSGSISGSYAAGSESTGVSPPPLPQGSTGSSVGASQAHSQHMGQLPSNRLDYDQIGIDFVLTYDSRGRPILPAPPRVT
jgi:hypothetical protein